MTDFLNTETLKRRMLLRVHLMHWDECFRDLILQNNLSFFSDGKQILNKLQMFLAWLKHSYMKIIIMLY